MFSRSHRVYPNVLLPDLTEANKKTRGGLNCPSRARILNMADLVAVRFLTYRSPVPPWAERHGRGSFVRG